MTPTLKVDDNIVQGSTLAAVNDGTHVVLIYQRSEGVLRVCKQPLGDGRARKQGTDITTITGSPVAPVVLGYKESAQINLFYIDQDFNLTERTNLLGKGNTKQVRGKDQLVPTKANPVAGLAAVVYTLDGNKVGKREKKGCAKVVASTGVPHTTVFYQDFQTNKIHRLTRKEGEPWGKPEVVPVAPLVVTSLAAAVSVKADEGEIHLYYQEKGITLRESVYNGTEWREGDFRPGNIALQSPLATTVVKGTALVYYRELSGTSFVGDDSGPGDGAMTTDITEDSGFKHTAVRVKDNLRFYYQGKSGDLKCLIGDLQGKEWVESP